MPYDIRHTGGGQIGERGGKGRRRKQLMMMILSCSPFFVN